ncbi:hypothetical protein [Fibrobacter sp. HC4]|uniref:hypothetical protein n=1 Tax=Fibrobacter sp. HC4 TaxID=3239812 RepID=UPI0020189982|nr:hypothetical protein [Fibrobacter succinogenes]MCL4100582.1 hypothetical protein [Fibrobacter succinogenes]
MLKDGKVDYVLWQAADDNKTTFDSRKKIKFRLIVGSANFTNAAFSRNTEACVYIDDLSTSDEIVGQALELIHNSYCQGKLFNKKSLEQYKVFCKKNQARLQKVSGDFGLPNDKCLDKIRPTYEMKSVSLTWEKFYDTVKNEEADNEHGPWIERRLKVLEYSQALFRSCDHFSELNLDARRFIAGQNSELFKKAGLPQKSDTKFFGSMQAAKDLKPIIKNNDRCISLALDCIPLEGAITKKHYNDFVSKILEYSTGIGLAIATRLLTMKRPDFFVCIDSKNEKNLLKDFGIENMSYLANSDKRVNFERYWKQVLGRLHDSFWWNSKPTESASAIEKAVWKYRTAFVDSLFYDEFAK